MIKGFIVTIALWDAVYREFINIWMLQSAKNMNQIYDRERGEHHIFFSPVMDYFTNYYTLHEHLKNKDERTLVVRKHESTLLEKEQYVIRLCHERNLEIDNIQNDYIRIYRHGEKDTGEPIYTGTWDNSIIFLLNYPVVSPVEQKKR